MDNQEDENLGSFYMARARDPLQPRRLLPAGLLTTLALLAFAGIVWYAYPRGAEKYTDMAVPVIKADTEAVKVAPVDPGGMEVPHQDSTAFDPLTKRSSGEVEKFLPAAEEPMDTERVFPPAEKIKLPPEAVVAPKLDLESKMTEEEIEQDEPVMQAVVPEPKVLKPSKPVAPKAVQKKPHIPEKTSAATGNVYIQLGSFREVSRAQTEWKNVKKQYPQFFGKLMMRSVRVDLPGKGVYYRLQAGALGKARAEEVCAALKKANTGGCIVVK